MIRGLEANLYDEWLQELVISGLAKLLESSFTRRGPFKRVRILTLVGFM